MLKRLFSLLTVVTVISVSASAQLKVFNHLGADLSVGTTGIGVELSTTITPYVQLRAGLSVMPNFSFTANVDGTVKAWNETHTPIVEEDLDGKVTAGLKRTQGDIIVNVYPFGGRSNFFVAGGMYFGGRQLLSIDGHSNKVAQLQEAGRLTEGFVDVGSYRVKYEDNGNVYGGLAVNKVRPYLGLGFGRACPKGRLGYMVELGLQFMGKMKVCQGKDLEPIDMEPVKAHDNWQKWMDKITVYPMLKVTLSGRIL